MNAYVFHKLPYSGKKIAVDDETLAGILDDVSNAFYEYCAKVEYDRKWHSVGDAILHGGEVHLTEGEIYEPVGETYIMTKEKFLDGLRYYIDAWVPDMTCGLVPDILEYDEKNDRYYVEISNVDSLNSSDIVQYALFHRLELD